MPSHKRPKPPLRAFQSRRKRMRGHKERGRTRPHHLENVAQYRDMIAKTRCMPAVTPAPIPIAGEDINPTQPVTGGGLVGGGGLNHGTLGA